MANTAKYTTAKLPSEEKERRMLIGEHLWKLLADPTARNRIARVVYGITTSTAMSDYSNIGGWFGKDGPFGGRNVLEMKWLTMITLARVTKDRDIRFKLTELVLNTYEHPDYTYSLPDDSDYLNIIVKAPEIYREDVNILFYKMMEERGEEIAEENQKYLLMDTPDLIAIISDQQAMIEQANLESSVQNAILLMSTEETSTNGSIPDQAADIEIQIENVQQDKKELNQIIKEYEELAELRQQDIVRMEEFYEKLERRIESINLPEGQALIIQSLEAVIAKRDEEIATLIAANTEVTAQRDAAENIVTNFKAILEMMNEIVTPRIVSADLPRVEERSPLNVEQ